MSGGQLFKGATSWVGPFNELTAVQLAYGQIGPKIVRTRDSSAPVLRHFGPNASNAKTVQTIGKDTSVLGPKYFGTSAKVCSDCDT